MIFKDVSVKDLKQLDEIITKLFATARYLESLNLNECEAAREAYEKLVDVQIYLMDSYFALGINKATNDLKKCLDVILYRGNKD